MSNNRNLSVLAQGVSSSGALNASYGGSITWQSVQTASFTAVAGNAYAVNTTSAAVTVTLPASPVIGQAVQITDYAGTFGTNACTVNPNGNKLNGLIANGSLLTNRESVAIVYIDSTQGWIVYSAYLATSLPQGIAYLIAGGGGGGSQGGGGAGGVLAGNYASVPGTVYSFVVGAGGTGSAPTSGTVNAGVSSTAFGLTAVGGGGGGSNGGNGGNGSSGGGGGAQSGYVTTGGTGTSGQGFAGGNGSISSPYSQGGGGGAGAAGAAGSGNQSGNGGVGLSSTITGTATYYGGGGGGGIYSSPGIQGIGGNGGGGSGGTTATAGTAGTANTGGGGGGAGAQTVVLGGNGGSGVVIISVPTANYTGTYTGSPTITTSSGSTILKFTASGSYTA